LKRTYKYLKRIFTILFAFVLIVGGMPATGIEGMRTLIVQAAEVNEGYVIDNGYVKVTVSDKNGGFGIRTVVGDIVNKDDDNKYLLFEYDEDNTSFTSFQVTRNGETKEYIFGGKYPGSSKVKVSKEDETLVAVWSVDKLTFTQRITLVDTGANEHGTAYINYTVENTGAPADVKCRILMDTALGYQDYAYYNLGDMTVFVDKETTVTGNGYSKAFYAVNDPDYPSMTAYTINAAIDNQECKPYQVTYGHWNNLAATVFDYTIDKDMTFVNAYNKEYLTADSAYALYFDMGNVEKDGSAIIGTNYGIFSNETVSAEATTSVNVVAPDVLQYAKDPNGKEIQSRYENDGIFTVKTFVENFSDISYEKVKILVYATGGIDPLNQMKEPVNATYEDPYYLEIKDFNAGEKQDIEWYFKAEPQAVGQYAKVHYKVYNVSDSATLGTGAIMTENLLGEGCSYILCPGSVEKIPAVKFTGTTPETIYTEGNRNLYLTGENFSLLLNTGAYQMILSRVDGAEIDGNQSFVIPDTQIKLDDYKNTMTVTLTDDLPGKLPEGMYQLTIDYIDESAEDLSGKALRFQVLDDVKYKNDAYGFLAVMKDTNSSASGEILYKVRHFESEEAYQTELEAERVKRDEVILEFRGVFIKNDDDPNDKEIIYEGISLSDDDNVMTLNDCLDIKNGTLTVIENDGSVKVDFEAELYTTGAGTFVWSGVAALTELEAGTDYGLIPYDENGNRENFNHEVIALIWPSVGQGFQNLMGMLFDLKYGELGVIEHSEDARQDTRIVGFGASMDLSFIIPDANPSYGGRTKDYLGSSYDAAEHNAIKFSPEECRALVKRAGGHNVSTVNTEATSWQDRFVETGTLMGDDASGGDGDTKSACIQIDDILFGGKYLGVNMSIALGVPAYIDGMPAMESLLTIRTVGDWAFGVSGVCNFELFYLEGSILIQSRDGIPVPDTITFFLGGIEPGINLDGFGVLWLQGAGGGIENLYDTIFLSDTIPPLKLILEAQFSLMQVISARASLGLSLRGVDVTLSNGKLLNALPVLNYATVKLDWYPEFYFMGGAKLSVLNAIVGSGYIVVEESGFFEFFIRAALQVPESIPVVGGIQIAGANMGVNLDKIWGQVDVLNIGLGVTYYWGGDIDWNSGSLVYPTYPELAGMEGRSAMIAPVGYDEESGETLYAMIGTNLRRSAMTLRNSSGQGTMQSNGAIGDELKTNDLSRSTEHTMKLAQNGNSKMLVIEWEAENKEQAYKDVTGDDATENPGISIVNVNAADGEAPFYEIKLLDKTVDTLDAANQGANANLTYDTGAKKASLAITFTKQEAFGPSWKIYTPEGATLVLYDIEPLPELTQPAATDVTVAANGESISVNVTGSKLEKFDKLSFVAESESGDTVLLQRLEGDIAAQTQTAVTFAVPKSLSSGTYTLHITAWDDNAQYYSEVTTEFAYVNPNQPTAPVIEAVAGAGDYKALVTIGAEQTDDFMGYAISAYDKDGNPVSGVTDLLYYKDGNRVKYNENGIVAPMSGQETTREFVIGGHYEYPYTDPDTQEETTIIAGFLEGEYMVAVKKWKLVNNGMEVLYSDSATKNVTIVKPVKTVIEVSPVLPDGTKSNVVTIVQREATAMEEEISYQQTIYNSSEITLTLSSDMQSFNGRWELDGGTREGTSGKIEELTKSTQVTFEDLSDGTHTLEFFGKNQYGDSLGVKHSFTVDTQGPRLLLSAPINGSFFDYWTGALTVSGITDQDSKLTILDETTGETIYSSAGRSIVQVDEFGRFTTDITLDRIVLEHTLTLIAEDAIGNVTEKQVTVVSDGLGSIDELKLFAGNNDVTNKKINAGTLNALKLMAKLKRPSYAEASDEELYVQINKAGLVEWSQTVVAGEAEIMETPSGINHKTSVDSEGMITAAFLVSDAGAHTVCASFGNTGEVLIDMEAADITVKVDDAFYTSEAVLAKVEVWYKDELLTEGTDYQVTYNNNIEVSAGKAEKPEVVITGMGDFTGSRTQKFEITYLPMEHGWYHISGTEGMNNYYTSDVSVMAAKGYEIISNLSTQASGNITIREEKENETVFWIRRISDGAFTDKVNLKIKVDKTAPNGTISMKDRNWDKFLTAITFGRYQSESYSIAITASDNYSGVDNIQYIITDTVYGSIAELNAAVSEWQNYSSLRKPILDGEGKYIVYVKITDKAGNISYISSDGLVIEGDDVEANVPSTDTTDGTPNTSDNSHIDMYILLMGIAVMIMVVIFRRKKEA